MAKAKRERRGRGDDVREMLPAAQRDFGESSDAGCTPGVAAALGDEVAIEDGEIARELWARVRRGFEAPMQAMRESAIDSLRENSTHDATCFARLTELQLHARGAAQDQAALGREPSGFDGNALRDLLAKHTSLVADAYHETLDAKAEILRKGLENVQQEAGHAWSQCLAERLEVASAHIRFLRASHEEKLARARKHCDDLVFVERQKQNDERARLERSLEASHRRATALLQQEHSRVRQSLEQSLGAERRKTQALSSAMLANTDKIQQLENQCKQLAQENATLRSQLECQAGEMEGKAANAQVFIGVLQRQLRVALDNVERLEADVEDRDERVKELDSQVEALTTERDGLATKLESTEAVLQVFREDLVTCQQDLGAERDACEKAEAALASTAEQLEVAMGKCTQEESRRREVEADLAKMETTLANERSLWREQAAQHVEDADKLQRQVNSKAEKVKELQFGMQEYAKLQQRYRELDVQRQEAEDLLAQERREHAEQQDRAQRCTRDGSESLLASLAGFGTKSRPLTANTSESSLWTDLRAGVETEAGTMGSPPTDLSGPGPLALSRHTTVADFLARLSHARQASQQTTMIAEDGDLFAVPQGDEAPLPANGSGHEAFFQATDDLRVRMEQELRETMEQDLREEIERECVARLRGELEHRLRKELEARNKIALQRLVNAELARLAPSESSWAVVLRKHRQAMDEVSLQAGRVERKFAHLHNKLENTHADCNALRAALREKDRVLMALTDNLQRARVKTEKLLPSGRSNNQLDVALVCLADETTLQALRGDNASRRPRTAPSCRRPPVLTELISDDDDTKEEKFGGDHGKKATKKSRTAARVAAEKQAAKKRQIVFGHRAVRALQHKHRQPA